MGLSICVYEDRPSRVPQCSACGKICISVGVHPVRGNGRISSRRTDQGILSLIGQAQAIWLRANILFHIELKELHLNPDVAEYIQAGRYSSLPQILLHPYDSPLHIFFVRQLGLVEDFGFTKQYHRPNGIAIGSTVALISDQTSAEDFRSVAHEIGHLLGLKHTIESAGRLLFPHSSGTELSKEEIALARLHAFALANDDGDRLWTHTTPPRSLRLGIPPTGQKKVRSDFATAEAAPQ